MTKMTAMPTSPSADPVVPGRRRRRKGAPGREVIEYHCLKSLV